MDPEFNDDIPPNNQHSKDNFFAVYGPVFERNARYDDTGSFDNLIALWASKSVFQVAQPILKWLMVLCFNAMNNTFLCSISNHCLVALGNFVLILDCPNSSRSHASGEPFDMFIKGIST